MSATGRTPGVREKDDAYPTERYCVERLLERVAVPAGRWVECAAGEGDIIRVARAQRPDVVFDAVELRAVCRPLLEPIAERVTIGDWLKLPHDLERYQGALSNPPFKQRLPERFLESLLVARHLWIGLLLPLGWLSSARRAPMLSELPPDVYVLPNRPIFRGTHGDQVDYGWFVWPPRTRRRRLVGSLQVLGTTPREVRVQQRAERREWALSVNAPSRLPCRKGGQLNSDRAINAQ